MIFDNSEFFDRSGLEKHQRVESVSPDLKLLDFELLENQLPLLSSATGLPTSPTITLPPQPTPPTGLAGTNLTQGADSSGFSEGADIIYSLGGNDGLVMRGGDDIVFGGDGDDIIYGQDGDDQLYGEGGIDRLFGGDGDDILDGGADADVLDGGAGNDTMILRDGNDTAYGQDGDDIIYGGDGSDTIFGGAGNDQADGGAGVDVLIMGDGNDTVLAGAGDDVIYGEAGDDAIDGGSGNDTIFGGSGNNTLIGGAGIDVLVAEGGNDAIYGGADNDVIYAFGGDDIVDGGDGSDTIFGGEGNDTLRGGAGDDVIADVSGNDTLDGGDGNDVVNGLAGNDRITGGNGDNIVLGGTGADVFYQAGTGIDRIQDFQIGVDKIELSASVADFNALIASAQDNVDANGNSQVIISNGEGGFFVLSNLTAADLSVSDFTYRNEAPVFTSGAAASVAENQNSAFTASASDAENVTLTYSLSGADAALFNINAATGVVTFKTVPDFEAPGDADGNNAYDVIVTVSDGTNSTNQAVVITVTNVNDVAPVFTSTASVVLTEGQTAAFTAQATDVEGDTLTYALSGTDAALFNIDAATGAVTFKAAPDFEVPADDGGNNIYDVIVTTSDGINTADQSVVISVVGGNDNAPVFSSGATASVAENQTSAYTASATDADGNQIYYSLSGADLALFNIDANGVVTFKTAPDFEAPGDADGDNVYDIVVTAEDGGFQTNHAVAITVTDVEEAARVTDLTTLTAAQGFIVQGDMVGDQAGGSVSNAGDINGDGFDDLIIGARYGDDGGDNSGEAYVIYGGSEITGPIDLTGLTAAQGFIIQGDVADDRAGISVSSAGDVNGDGFSDLIVGAHFGDDGGFSAGEAYVVYGGVGITGPVDLTNLTSSQGFIIQGDEQTDQAGHSVSSVGDINGDGFDDLIVGAPIGFDGGALAGEAYVIYGGSGIINSIDLSTLTAAQGFIVQGDMAGDGAGVSVSNAGDVNGDGFDDLIVGAPGGDDGGYDAGEAYVIFGGSGGFGTADGSGRQVIDLTNLSIAQGFIIQGDMAADGAGGSISSGGDVNGDGFDDLIVGAAAEFRALISGSSYVIYGGATGTENTTSVSSVGTAVTDNFTGNAGNDTFAGIATGDVVRGGAGNDRITVTSLDFANIRGGTGVDTLVLDGAGLSLDATGPGNASLGSIEVFDITGSGNNTLTLDALAVFDLTEERSGGRATLDVRGNAGDTVDLTGGNFTAGVQVVEGGITYNSFTDGNATVRVQDGVTVTLMPPPVAEKIDVDAVIAERPVDALWFQDGPIHIA